MSNIRITFVKIQILHKFKTENITKKINTNS
jgi:hypothetical protein